LFTKTIRSNPFANGRNEVTEVNGSNRSNGSMLSIFSKSVFQSANETVNEDLGKNHYFEVLKNTILIN
jgi:hypothetical protein